MPQQNNNPNVKQQNQDGQSQKDQPPKMAPDHDNRPKQAQDNNQGDKPDNKATSNKNE
ncbi:MAG: hypothetical protein ACTHPD_05430 [Rhizomicrobium sp.]